MSCYEPPGWGGAATVCYLLFERMQRLGLDVSYVTILHEKDELFLRHVFGGNMANPKNLPNVHVCLVREPLWRKHAELAELLAKLAPETLVCFGFIPTYLLSLVSGSQRLAFITAGCTQVRQLIEKDTVRDYIDFRDKVLQGVAFPVEHEGEAQAVAESDVVIPHSPIVRFSFGHFFPQYQKKIYPRVMSIADLVYEEAYPYRSLARPFESRDIDVLLIASSWDRHEKNFGLVREIIAECRGLNIHVVGHVSEEEPGATYHGIVSLRRTIYALLARSKSVLSPSVLDAAPGILFEGSAMGCNVLTSENCGNWQLCNDALLVKNCSSDAFIERIGLAVSRKYPDHQERFRGDCDRLVDVLTAF